MKSIITNILSLAAVAFIIGCAPTPADPNSASDSTPATDTQNHDDHGHDHSATGPHDGALIGLGGEAFHLEWLHENSIFDPHQHALGRILADAVAQAMCTVRGLTPVRQLRTDLHA